MLIGQSVLIPASGDPGVTYYGPWTPRQGGRGTAILEIMKASSSGWGVIYEVETKNAEDPDSAADRIGYVNISAVGTHLAHFSDCLELVRVKHKCTGNGTARWITCVATPFSGRPAEEPNHGYDASWGDVQRKDYG